MENIFVKDLTLLEDVLERFKYFGRKHLKLLTFYVYKGQNE